MKPRENGVASLKTEKKIKENDNKPGIEFYIQWKWFLKMKVKHYSQAY